MASLKQARYLREKNENSKATVFYIDIRTVGRWRSSTTTCSTTRTSRSSKARWPRSSEDPESKDLILKVEDTLSGEKLQEKFDMVVLATGMVPNTADAKIPFDLTYDEYGFIDGSTDVDGVYAAGCAKHPCDVSRTTKESTAAALKAIQCLERG